MKDQPPPVHPDEIRDKRRLGRPWDPRAIECLAEEVHKRLRFRIGDSLPHDPKKAIEMFGFDVERHGELFPHTAEGRRLRIAGFLEGTHRVVGYSDEFPKPIQNFTLAHELGHILLHRPMHQHRDRPSDGSRNTTHDPREWESDQFAKFFLMPSDSVREQFRRRFLTNKFELNEATAFALLRAALADVLTLWRSRREGAKLLAEAKHFNGNNIEPLHKAFGVSLTAMAIRLEELDLL